VCAQVIVGGVSVVSDTITQHIEVCVRVRVRACAQGA
jgi:hypothetical protein